MAQHTKLCLWICCSLLSSFGKCSCGGKEKTLVSLLTELDIFYNAKSSCGYLFTGWRHNKSPNKCMFRYIWWIAHRLVTDLQYFGLENKRKEQGMVTNRSCSTDPKLRVRPGTRTPRQPATGQTGQPSLAFSRADASRECIMSLGWWQKWSKTKQLKTSKCWISKQKSFIEDDCTYC